MLVLVSCNPAGSASGPLPTTTPLPPSPTAPPAATPIEGLAIRLSTADGADLGRVVDGNAIRLEAVLSEAPSAAAEVVFELDGHPNIARCAIPAGSVSCAAHVRADGWAWEKGKRVPSRTVSVALSEGTSPAVALTIPVAPKPAVLVHGLNSDQTSWVNWIEPGGYLQEANLPGYAVDDGQFGTRRMHTGNPKKPLERTLSIAENAQVVAEYVAAVRANTGAERVDLVGHSLGGLISRYYIQNLMPEVSAPGLAKAPVVNQLVIAGTPNGGSACGRPLAALRLFAPAGAQFTPEYISQVFNPVVRDRRGVPFYAIAGDAVKESAIKCSAVPSDSLVSVDSVLHGIPVMPITLEARHADLNNGRPSFERILGLLARGPAEYPIVVKDETTPKLNPELMVQSTLVQGGTLETGKPVTVTIPIDLARSASFMLYAPGSTVTMQIKTVAGKILTEETPITNPKVSFERVLEPATPMSLGYGVLDPKAGPWEIGLTASDTPPGGGPFAVMATLDTDLRMSAEASPGLVKTGQPVALRASLEAAEPPLEVAAVVLVREARDAREVEIPLAAGPDGTFVAEFSPPAPGLYSAVLSVTGKDAAGNPFQRMSVLGFEAID
jgi:pimeloyl-ACP methyl ester carboxylesterase